jgi:hypothetical protein
MLLPDQSLFFAGKIVSVFFVFLNKAMSVIVHTFKYQAEHNSERLFKEVVQ